MTPFEKMEILLEELKASRKEPADFFSSLISVFPIFTREQRQKISTSFFEWSKPYKESKPLLYGYGLYTMGTNDFFNERFEVMIPNTIEAQRIFAENDAPDGVAVCSATLGSAYRSLGNFDIALNHLWEAREQLNKSGAFPFSNLVCNFNIGRCYLEMKQYDHVLENFLITLEKAEKFQNKLWMSNAYNGIGRLYLQQKKYAEAKEYLEKGLAVCREMKSASFESIALTDLGVYYSETGDYAQAEYHFVESMKLLNKENFMGNTVMNMIELGNVKFKAGKTDEAISMLQEALDEAEKIKIKARISQIHLLLSQIFQKTNELAKSLSHYQTYHRISEEVEKEEAAKKVKNLQLIFESEQTKKENIIIKKQKQEIEKKNTELQETIDELTRAKVSRRAKAITMVVAIVLIVTEDFLVDITINNLPVNDYLWSFLAKGAIILSLKPIENLIEHFLMDKLVKKKKLIRETV